MNRLEEHLLFPRTAASRPDGAPRLRCPRNDCLETADGGVLTPAPLPSLLAYAAIKRPRPAGLRLGSECTPDPEADDKLPCFIYPTVSNCPLPQCPANSNDRNTDDFRCAKA